MSGFALNPPRAPLVDADGNIKPEWYRFFTDIQKAIGGPVSPSDDAIVYGQQFAAGAFAGTLTAGAGLTGGGNMAGNLTVTVGAGTGITINADDVALDITHVRNVDHSAVTLTAGAGLTGGGTIEASRTFDVGAGTGITVNANDVALDTAHVRNVDHSAVTITAGAGLTGGGTIEATRTLDIGAGTGITVNANDVSLSNIAGVAGTYTPPASIQVDGQGRIVAIS